MKPLIDHFSISSVPLFMLHDGLTLSHGTCFFIKQDTDVYLITNWHNLSGKNTDTGEILKTNPMVIPNKIQVPFHKKDQLGTTEIISFDLYSSNNNALWLQHPDFILQNCSQQKTFGKNVDIGVYKLTVPEGLIVYPINEIPQQEDMRIGIAMDVFILGFPLDLFSEYLPIWKRATIASEPDYKIHELPKFLVDTATYPGMSGSPAILYSHSFYRNERGDLELPKMPAAKFLGIYSGRYSTDNITKTEPAAAQLGIIWKKELIYDIIQSGVPANSYTTQQ